MAVAASPGELADRLRLLVERLDTTPGQTVDPVAGIAFGQSGAPRIVFLFPGQAAPAALDGGLWRRRFPEVDRLYAEAALPASGDEMATEVAQPAIVTASLGALRLLDMLGIAGMAAVGHSLGELTALHWGGAWDAHALLRLARGRGQIMAERSLPGGAMALIGDSAAVAGSLLDGTDGVIACFNAPRECVVAGTESTIAEILARARRVGIFARRLPVSHAFHSRFVAPASAAVADLVRAEPAEPLRATVFSTVTGTRLKPSRDLADLLSAQIVAPVRFCEAFTTAMAEAELMIEVGPGHGLTRIAGELAGPPAIALDAGGNSVKGLLLAAGTAFVLGAPVRIGALFDGRFIRPFGLDRDRRFLANPCETAPIFAGPQTRKPVLRAPPASRAMPGSGQSPLDVVRALVANRLEIAVEAVEPGQRLLGDLHLNSIAVGQLVAEAARALGLSPPAAPTNFAMATVNEVAKALALGALLPTEDRGSLPAGVDSWVRVFVPELVERPLDRLGEASPRTWRVFAPAGHPIAMRLPHGPDGVAICLPEHPRPEHLSLLLEGARAAMTSADGAFVVIVQLGGGGAAFARCLALEDPGLRVRVVDLPFDHPDAVAWLAAEAEAAGPSYVEAHYDRLGVRRVPLLRVLPSPDRAPCLRSEDVVLVSGGAKGISCECVLALARRAGCKVAILGRSATDAPEVTANLARLKAAGVQAAYGCADVTDHDAVSTVVARLEAALGPVTALIHAAGINRPAPLMQLDPASLRDTVAVKVDGARNLLAVLDPLRLRLFVAFGSIIARTGLPGEAHYALANEWLGRLVEDFAGRYPSCRCHVLEWSAWSGVGMAERLGAVEGLAHQGVAALGVDEATAMFEAIVSQPPIRPAAVIAGRFGDPPTVDLARPSLPALRFLEHVRVFYPEVELVAEAELTAASDPYLAEHALAATPLFPAVLGLEAMVQAATAVAGGRHPKILEGVEFRQPVTAGAERCRLRVAALARTADRVETVLRSDTTGFQSDHFRAVAHFDRATARDTNSIGDTGPLLALDPAELYGRLMFHTGRFRRLGGYSALSATSCIARIEPAEDVPWFPARPADDLMLGDPGARDAALHALQVCIPHRRVLPVTVGRIELGYLQFNHAYTVHGTETKRDGGRFTFDLEIREPDGTLAERWEGLVLQAIEALTLPERWPVPLAAPFLERRLDEFFPALGIRIAITGSGRKGVAPSSTAVIGAAFGATGPLLRRPDGKPEVDGFVSASHSGTLTLAVAASSPIGCDLEAVEERPEPVWRDLLGPERLALACLAAKEGGEAFTRSATRVWAAVEALQKTGAAVGQMPVTLDRVEDDWIIFAAGAFTVASRVEAFDCEHRGPFAIAIAARQLPIAAVQLVAVTRDPAVLPRERCASRPSYSYRHVVGFSDTNLVGNVYFVNYLEWQGRCREMFLRDKAPSVLEDFAHGLALVTTKCSCKYLAELNAFDEVRVDMRLKALTASRIELGFEYWRCRDGSEELAAVGEQEIACMRSIGDRKVPEAVPPALVEALQPYGSSPPG
jgi:enediyne polyketide synthase